MNMEISNQGGKGSTNERSSVTGVGGEGSRHQRRGYTPSRFDLSFEGEQEKVVIDSLLFIPPSHSSSSFFF